MAYTLKDFARESNMIEGIEDGAHNWDHHEALKHFLSLNTLRRSDLEEFVSAVEPGAFLRTRPEHRVRVGNHVAPPSALALVELAALLDDVNDKEPDPYVCHQRYEAIHPFIDGNGRSGRALWLWIRVKRGWNPNAMPWLFLQAWYYESLSAWRDE
jgi:Fic family protein